MTNSKAQLMALERWAAQAVRHLGLPKTMFVHVLPQPGATGHITANV